MRVLILGLLVIVVIALVPAVLLRRRSGEATGEAANERIFFTSGRDGNNEIYLMDPNGGGQTRITNDAGDDGFPVPGCAEGEAFFQSDRGGGVPHIWKVTVAEGWDNFQAGDTPVFTQITSGPSADSFPSVGCPSGDLAFARETTGNNIDIFLHIPGIPGDTEQNLTNRPGLDGMPMISPDGLKFTFVSDRDAAPSIYGMNRDGSGVTRLTTPPAGAADFAPKWSFDGTKFAFARATFPSLVFKINVANADGSGLTPVLPDLPGSQDLPFFSPDGTKLAFNRDDGQIWKANLDGSGLTPLTTGAGPNRGPSWAKLPVSVATTPTAATPTAPLPPPYTPAPTYTPALQLNRIYVLKKDQRGTPVPGWRINLFEGGNCFGEPIQYEITSEGGARFDVAPGRYSVGEKPRSGWEPITNACIQVEPTPGESIVFFHNRQLPTPTPAVVVRRLGDVNGDGRVNSIDATIGLQFEAGLLDRLLHPENADVNRDGHVNSVDWSLILQHEAGFYEIG